MFFPPDFEKFLPEAIVFLTFILICGGLMECRFSRKASFVAAIVTVAGIFLIQSALLFFGWDTMLVLTVLPLTAYLPAIVCLHVLSRAGFYQTVAIWTAGVMVCFILESFRKILLLELGTVLAFSGWKLELLIDGSMLLLSALLLFLIFRFLREPFRSYVLHNRTNWLLLCFPIFMIFLLFSYFTNSTTNVVTLFLLFLTAISVFLVLARVLMSAASITKMKETERAVTLQMQMQRQEYEDVCSRMEMGRAYRHDMRHHLRILEGLAEQGNATDVAEYIRKLTGQISNIEKNAYCENPTVNAVLASCIGRAESAHCAVTADVFLPRELPFDALDIGIVLANALENATNACQEIDESSRYIHLSAQLTEDHKLTISIENPCGVPPSFDEDGFPVAKRGGHGIGLRSIYAVVKKYHGVFQCEYKNGEFCLNTVLFSKAEQGSMENAFDGKTQKKKISFAKVATYLFLILLLFFVFVNCTPAMAETLSEAPGLGAVIRVMDVRTHALQWGDTSLLEEVPVMGGSAGQTDGLMQSDIESPENTVLPEDQDSLLDVPEDSQPMQPENENTGDTTENLNQQVETYIQQIREKFLWYVTRKYNGYVAEDTTYQILRDDEKLFSVLFETTINVGGSVQYSRHFTLDKESKSVLELRDLFLEGSDYIQVISEEILRQMTQQVNEGQADYFIPGGIWSDEECFKEIAEDQNFYVNDDDELVIVFDEYEVAPGSMGMPEFVIPTEILSEILQQPSVIE